MSANKVTLRDDRRLVNTIKQQGRFIRELKTPQNAGADVLPVSTGFLTAGPITIGTGSVHSFTINVTTGKPNATLWNFLLTVYLDAHDDAHKWPDGSTFTFALLSRIIVSGLQDYHDANLSLNTQVYKFVVINNDGVPHDVYFDFLAVKPFIG